MTINELLSETRVLGVDEDTEIGFELSWFHKIIPLEDYAYGFNKENQEKLIIRLCKKGEA